jgi:type II secretory pathway pseudopilin PulG
MTSIPLLNRLILGIGLRGNLKRRSTTSTAGFTLIEALVAIIIVSVTLVSITPPIFLATATRVQNRRVQQAQQIAQGEIDRVRVLMERQQAGTLALLPPLATGNVRSGTTPPAPSGTSFARLRSPLAACNTDDGTTPPANGFLVSLNPTTCTPDFIVQTFRGGEIRVAGTAVTAAPDGFVMGVRVYSIIARGNTLSTQPAALRATNGLGNQQNRPLAVLYATIVRNNSSKSLEIYQQLCPATEANKC